MQLVRTERHENPSTAMTEETMIHMMLYSKISLAHKNGPLSFDIDITVSDSMADASTKMVEMK